MDNLYMTDEGHVVLITDAEDEMDFEYGSDEDDDSDNGSEWDVWPYNAQK